MVGMNTENALENKPLYRFFNVVLFILYSFVILITILAGFVGYSSRELISATVECKDGTSWDATKIYWDSHALCGICTKRSADGSKYTECDYEDMDYSVYEVVDKKYAWSWNVAIYPLVVFIIGFGLVDFLRLAVGYIFSGRIAFENSLLLKLVALMSQS